MSDQSAPSGWSNQPIRPASFPGAPSAPAAVPAGAHPLLWARMPAEMPSPLSPSSPQEALAMMERSHAATIALLPEDTDPEADETTPLTRAWFDGVRDACARTGRVPAVERMLFEWWINDPPFEGLSQLPWLFGVWQGHWICWAGTTPWAAADLAAKSTYDADHVAAAVQFGTDPDHPPATPWPPFGTAAMAVPTTILLALSGKPASKQRIIPVTPIYVAPAPPPPPAPAPPPPPPPPPAPVVAPLPEAVVPAATIEPEPTDPPLVPEAPAPTLPVADEEPTPPPDLSAESDASAEEVADAEPERAPEGVLDPDPETPDATAAAPEPETPEPETPAVVEQPAPATVPGEPEPVAEMAPVAPIEPTAPPTLPPAGWFPDPAGRHALRYWDGTDWTAHAADPGSDTIHDPI